MHEAYVPVVELADGMILGGPTWLERIAHNCDLSYSMAHRYTGFFSQAWCVSMGQGLKTVWAGETSFHSAHPTLEFSAWVGIPAPDASQPYAELQIYYGGGWHALVTDTNQGDHWLDDANDVNGVVSYDISSYYNDGDIVRARLVVAGNGNTGCTNAATFRALLTGRTGFPDWPNFPTFAGSPTVHTAADFNTLRDATRYLKLCNERPLLGSEMGEFSHSQWNAYEDLVRWAFRAGGAQKLHLECTTACSDTVYIGVYLCDEQFPYGPNGGNRIRTLATYTTDGNQTLDVDISANVTTGTRYSIIIGGMGGASITINYAHLKDNTGLTRPYTYTTGEFAHGAIPSATTLNNLAADLEAQKPAVGKASPNWYEHEFSGQTTQFQDAGDQHIFTFINRKFKFCHTWPYLRYRGAGRLWSADLAHSQALSDTDPAGGDNLLDLRTLAWLAVGDWYFVQNDDSSVILTAYEDWMA